MRRSGKNLIRKVGTSKKGIKKAPSLASNLVNALHEKFKEASKPDKAAYMKKYMRNIAEYHGLQTPERTQIEKVIFEQFEDELKAIDRQNFGELMDLCFENSYREMHYSAIVILNQYYLPKLTEHDLPKLEEIVIKGKWWDITDNMYRSFHFVLSKDKSLHAKKNKEYLEHNDMWLRRVAILHQLYAKHSTNEEMLFDNILKTCHETDFFIRKAIGWALRNYSRFKPQAVVDFVSEHQERLSTLSKTEAIKYMKNHKSQFKGIKLPSFQK